MTSSCLSPPSSVWCGRFGIWANGSPRSVHCLLDEEPIGLGTDLLAMWVPPKSLYVSDTGQLFAWSSLRLLVKTVILNQLIGTVLMVISIAVVARARFSLKGQSFIKMEQIIRLLSFVVGYWAVYAYIIAFRGYIEETRTTPSQHLTLTMWLIWALCYRWSFHGCDSRADSMLCAFWWRMWADIQHKLWSLAGWTDCIGQSWHYRVHVHDLFQGTQFHTPFQTRKNNIFTLHNIGHLSILDGHDCKLERPLAHYHWCNFLWEHNNWITHQQQQECTVCHQK